MPFRDGTGPLGKGPGSGWGMGGCNGRFGRKFHPFSRFGRFRFRDQLSPAEEKKMLEEETALLKKDLSSMEKRIADLEKQ
jgi:hypothetical protein